jgi:2-dehydro-3-deoxyglucarate aldolase/4-hydroxy-2-oxoheptanedioate aldolase
MQTNSVKQKLRDGEAAVGTMVFEFNTSGIGRIIAETGAEFVLFDMEHTGWSIETIRELMATARAADVVPLVRVPATEYHFLARVLDIGAMGIMVPMVETEEQAQRIADSCRYPPVGRRGAAFGVAHDDYTGGDVLAKMQQANDNVLLIAQIETARGLENVEQIAAVDGIDILWIGQFDLSISLGIPGQFDHPKFQAAVKRIVDVATQNGKAAGYMALSVDEACQLHERGFRAIAYSGDLWIYQQALKTSIEAIRSRI